MSLSSIEEQRKTSLKGPFCPRKAIEVASGLRSVNPQLAERMMRTSGVVVSLADESMTFSVVCKVPNCSANCSRCVITGQYALEALTDGTTLLDLLSQEVVLDDCIEKAN